MIEYQIICSIFHHLGWITDTGHGCAHFTDKDLETQEGEMAYSNSQS